MSAETQLAACIAAEGRTLQANYFDWEDHGCLEMNALRLPSDKAYARFNEN